VGQKRKDIVRKLRLLVVAAGFIVCLQGRADAQSPQLLGILTRTDNSVTKVMQRAGCEFGWLSQILADTGINPAKTRFLPVGQKVFLRGGLCKNTPPEHVANLSRMFLRIDLNAKQTQALQAEMIMLRGSASGITAKLESVVVENTKLKRQIISLERELAKAKTAIADSKSDQGFNLQTLGSVGLLGFLSGFVLLYAIFSRLNRSKQSFPSKWTIKEDNRVYEFILVGAGETISGSGHLIGKYKCPLCSENNLFGRDRNLRTHIGEKHVQERITMHIDPSLRAAAGM